MRTSKHKNPILSPVNRRRKSALERLKLQLSSGNKLSIGIVNTAQEVIITSLSEVDIKRIQKELSVLESRIRF